MGKRILRYLSVNQQVHPGLIGGGLVKGTHRSRSESESWLLVLPIATPLPEYERELVVETQLEIEIQMGKALLSDGISPRQLIEERHKIRALLFYPRGEPLSLSTLTDHLEKIERGAHRSKLYGRLIEAARDHYKLNLVPPTSKDHP